MLTALATGPHIRVVRLVKGGPLCPCWIGWLSTTAEPGQSDNRMERSPHIGAFLSGQPVGVRETVKLFGSGKAGSSRITRAEYDRMVAEIAANVRAKRYEPRAAPYEAVRVSDMAIPFLEGYT